MEATREIMWNLNTLPNVIGLYGLLLVALVIGVNGVIRRVELWSSGQPSPEHSGHWLYRLDDLIQYGFFHKKVARSSSNGSAMAHLLVYLGFLVLFFTTTMVFIHHDLGIEIYKGQFYLYVTMFSDIFGLLMLAGSSSLGIGALSNTPIPFTTHGTVSSSSPCWRYSLCRDFCWRVCAYMPQMIRGRSTLRSDGWLQSRSGSFLKHRPSSLTTEPGGFTP